MKIRRFYTSPLLILLISILVGCNSSSLTEQEVIDMVMLDNSDEFGGIEIVSIAQKNEEYIIKWKKGNEKDENCKNGITYVNSKEGIITKTDHTPCEKRQTKN